MSEVHEALRRWAKGMYPLEAGVELLIQSFDGRFANPSQPWVPQGDDPGWWWIDVEQMTEDNYGALSGGETRLLRIAASLLGGPPVDLSSNLAGLDGQRLQLVVAAIAHANGGHDLDGWPEPAADDFRRRSGWNDDQGHLARQPLPRIWSVGLIGFGVALPAATTCAGGRSCITTCQRHVCGCSPTSVGCLSARVQADSRQR